MISHIDATSWIGLLTIILPTLTIAFVRWSEWRADKPDVEAFLRTSDDNYAVIIIENRGTRTAEDMTYEFLGDKKAFESFGCNLPLNEISAPANLVRGFPLTFRFVLLYQACKENGEWVPPLRVKICWKGNRKGITYNLDVRSLHAYSWSNSKQSWILQRLDRRVNIFDNIDEAARAVKEFFGHKNMKRTLKWQARKERCSFCGDPFSEHYHPFGNMSSYICPSTQQQHLRRRQ